MFSVLRVLRGTFLFSLGQDMFEKGNQFSSRKYSQHVTSRAVKSGLSLRTEMNGRDEYARNCDNGKKIGKEFFRTAQFEPE